MNYDICTIGHVTLDKVVTTQSTKYMPGGTSFYFSKAVREFDLNYMLVTALAVSENQILAELRGDGIEICALPTDHTVYFENIYSANQDHREQNVLHKAAPFSLSEMPAIQSRIFHLGPLLSDDIPADLVKELAQRGVVSLDVQGYLRYVDGQKVRYRNWAEKEEVLRHVSILKANEFEMEVVAGTKDVHDGAKYLADLGVKEVIITLGSQGSIVYKGGAFHEIPAFQPKQVVDATGCGDTYMAGYLLKKIAGGSVQESGEFGAAMATWKIQSSGPFSGTEQDVKAIVAGTAADTYERIMPVLSSTY